jgi:hypothetical protein
MLPLIQDAFVIAIVTYSVTVSLAKVFARQYGYSINSNQVGWCCALNVEHGQFGLLNSLLSH